MSPPRRLSRLAALAGTDEGFYVLALYSYAHLQEAGIATIPQYQVEHHVLDLAIIDGVRKLDIEVDGEFYHRDWSGELLARDRLRNERLFDLGWDVLRFWVYEIKKDPARCVERVRAWLGRTPEVPNRQQTGQP